MAYSREYFGKPGENKKEETPAISLELLAKQEEEKRKLAVEQGKVLTPKELQEQQTKRMESDEWREQK